MIEHELNDYWKIVVETIQDGIMIVDRNGTIVAVNSAFRKITGYTEQWLLGNSCTSLNCNTCEVNRDHKDAPWCRLFRKGVVKMKHCVIQKADGQYVHVLKNAAVLKDRQGQVIGGVETVTNITELLEKENQIAACQRELRSADGFHGILGSSPGMQKVFDLITNAAVSDAPVIILGESGTGKELVARAIHQQGPRKDAPYIKVNCAALNESLLESELFGHVKGAFTGAYQSRPGRFEAAQGGDLFLDEIGDLPLSTQVKLLRVLEEKVIERVGDNRPIRVDVRIITATNGDLKQMVADGTFRQDLFYRINVIPIAVPALRQRPGDIPLLAESFFRRIQLKNSKHISGIAPPALELMMRYRWPGNVRELKSALEFAFVSCPADMILPEHLPPGLAEKDIFNTDIQSPALSRQAVQKQALIQALRQTGGNRSKAAELLGISRVTVWNRIKKYAIDMDEVLNT